MNRRGVEFASALLLLAGTFGCVQKSSNLEYNTQARAAETANWQNVEPGAIYLGSVIITPDPNLNVRYFPRIPLFKPDNLIAWANIIRINGVEINAHKFSVKYPTLVYNGQSSSNLIYPASSPWIQLHADLDNNGVISTQKVYISFSEQTRDYLKWKQISNTEVMRKLISPGAKTDQGFQLYSTHDIIPNSEINQVLVCNPDNPCNIQPNETEILAQERFFKRLHTLTYRYLYIIGDEPGPDNNFLYENKNDYLKYGQRNSRLPVYFVLSSGNDDIQVALNDKFIKDTVVLIGTDIGRNVTSCTPNSEEKTKAYENLLNNFVPNGVVDRELLSILAQGATSCVIH